MFCREHRLKHKAQRTKHRGGIACGDGFMKNFSRIHLRSRFQLYTLFFMLCALKKSRLATKKSQRFLRIAGFFYAIKNYFLYVTVFTAWMVRSMLGRISSIKVGAYGSGKSREFTRTTGASK